MAIANNKRRKPKARSFTDKRGRRQYRDKRGRAVSKKKFDYLLALATRLRGPGGRFASPSYVGGRGKGGAPPPGFVEVVQTPREALRGIESLLAGLKAAVAAERGISAEVRVVRNKDRSIDGEIRLKLPRGVTARELFLLLSRLTPFYPEAWISLGVRLSSLPESAEEDKYMRAMGMFQIGTHPIRMRKRATAIATVLHKILKPLRQRRFKKPESIFLRLHWNPEGKRPKRIEKRKGRRR